jgi:hypothetical protein
MTYILQRNRTVGCGRGILPNGLNDLGIRFSTIDLVPDLPSKIIQAEKFIGVRIKYNFPAWSHIPPNALGQLHPFTVAKVLTISDDKSTFRLVLIQIVGSFYPVHSVNHREFQRLWQLLFRKNALKEGGVFRT